MVYSSTMRPGRAMVCLGAEHTIQSGLPLTRESGFFISACASKPGSVLAIQDPYGESGRPDFGQVFKYPALACFEQGGQCPRTIFLSFLGDAMKRYTGVSSSQLIKAAQVGSMLDAMAIYTPEGEGVISEGVA